MTSSKLVSRKMLILASIVAVAVGLAIWGLSPVIAALNQTVNSAAPEQGQTSNITGSVNTGHIVKNFIKDNPRVSFQQASGIAAKQITNGTIVGGHLTVVHGYLVYAFFVLNAQDHTGHLTIVDAGNGKVLYTSQGQQMGSLGRPAFGSFGQWGVHGFGGGFWHGIFGPWG
jgi:uncharacterized membrane protein YkoI